MPESPMTDFAAAQAAVANPATTADDLASIAQWHPGLRVLVANHPNAYDGLLDWMAGLGDPQVTEAVAVRRGQPAPAVPPAPTASAVDQPGQPSDQPAPAPAMEAQQVAYGQTPAGTGVSAKGGGKRPPLWVLIVAGILVVGLVVAGVFTRGFGLFGSGGAKTPGEEAEKVAEKVVSLVNSFNAKSLLSNPLGTFADLQKELAPSEASLLNGGSSPDLASALGISNDTIGWLSDVAGAFTISVEDLQTRTYNVTEDIAHVRFIGGTITVNADTGKLADVLNRTSQVIDQQITSTADTFGFQANLHPDGSDQTIGELLLSDGLALSDGWVDNLVADIEESFPYTYDLGEEWVKLESCLKELDPANDSAADYAHCLHGDGEAMGHYFVLTMVKENNTWYWSSMLQGALARSFATTGGYAWDLFDIAKEWVDEDKMDEWMETPRRGYASYTAPSSTILNNLAISPAKNNSPVTAAEALFSAIGQGDPGRILRQLPQAERRYAAYADLLLSMGFYDGGNSPIMVNGPMAGAGGDPEFSEISQSGDQALIRVDALSLYDSRSYDGFYIDNGSCFGLMSSDRYCLDQLASTDTTSLIDQLIQPDSTMWREMDIDGYALADQLDDGVKAAINAVHPDEIGLVAVKEDSGWHVTFSGTATRLQGQLMTALVAGIKAAQR